MREKEPGAIVENIFKTTRFKELFKKIPKVLKKGVRSAIIGGVRAEESPSRKLGLTESVKYKHVTWGRQNYHYSDDHCNYTFYPLYDWSYKDIWKYIHSSGVPYNHVYDEMFRYGVNPMDMRISNLNHETALSSMLLVQEIEPETWNKLAARIEGVNTVNQLRHDRACPQDLPFMFSDWQEYRDYLTHYLTKEPERTIFQEKWARWDAKTVGMKNKETMYKVQISCVILNDYHFTTFANWSSRIDVMDYFRYQRGMWHPRYAKSKYIFEDAK